jgi:ribonuclease HI
LKEVTVYTDGACAGNPGPGGWGAVLLYDGHMKELSGYEEWTTNQRMELTAAIGALKALNQRCRVTLYSDSAYLINAFRQNWFRQWLANGWRTTRGNKPVENRDLWEQLLALDKMHQIKWIKVKGHSDNKWNNRCDQLAREAIQQNAP